MKYYLKYCIGFWEWDSQIRGFNFGLIGISFSELSTDSEIKGYAGLKKFIKLFLHFFFVLQLLEVTYCSLELWQFLLAGIDLGLYLL